MDYSKAIATKQPHKSKLDRVFSRIIRMRGKCERCHGITDLQCSHINGRSLMSVRWEPLNCQCLCARCHGWYGLYRTAATRWVEHYLGAEKYAELNALTKKLTYTLTVQDVVDRWEEYGWYPKLWENDKL